MSDNDEIVAAHRQGYKEGGAAGEILRGAMADKIKALIKERDEANKRGDSWRFRADIAEVKLNKAVSALREIAAQTKDVTPELLNLDIAIHSVHSYANDILKDIV
jgi:hypothetical protein